MVGDEVSLTPDPHPAQVCGDLDAATDRDRQPGETDEDIVGVGLGRRAWPKGPGKTT